MLRAHSKRLANRTAVVGKTAFVFDKDGNTAVVDQGNTRIDYEQLLKMNQVVAIGEDKAVLVPDPPAQTVTPADLPGEVTTTAPEEPAPEPVITPSEDVVTSAPALAPAPKPESEQSQRRKKKMRRPVKKN